MDMLQSYKTYREMDLLQLYKKHIDRWICNNRIKKTNRQMDMLQSYRKNKDR
jgi:hypothetical protein